MPVGGTFDSRILGQRCRRIAPGSPGSRNPGAIGVVAGVMNSFRPGSFRRATAAGPSVTTLSMSVVRRRSPPRTSSPQAAAINVCSCAEPLQMAIAAPTLCCRRHPTNTASPCAAKSARRAIRIPDAELFRRTSAAAVQLARASSRLRELDGRLVLLRRTFASCIRIGRGGRRLRGARIPVFVGYVCHSETRAAIRQLRGSAPRAYRWIVAALAAPRLPAAIDPDHGPSRAWYDAPAAVAELRRSRTDLFTPPSPSHSAGFRLPGIRGIRRARCPGIRLVEGPPTGLILSTHVARGDEGIAPSQYASRNDECYFLSRMRILRFASRYCFQCSFVVRQHRRHIKHWPCRRYPLSTSVLVAAQRARR